MKRTKRWVPLAAVAVLLVVIVGAMSLLGGKGSKNTQNDPGGQPTPMTAASSSPAPTPKETDPPAEPYDVAIIGSEMEGMYLARAAKDEGLKVIVLDPRDQVGGQLLQGEMLFLDETRNEQGKLLVQGRAKELFDGFRNGKIRKLSEFTSYYNDKLAKDITIESGVKFDKIATGAGVNGTEAVQSIVYTDKEGKKKKAAASYWVENSDYAALASKLKATRLPGLEAFYGNNGIEYMSSGMMMKFKNVDWKTFDESSTAVNASYAIGLTNATNSYKPTNDRVFLRGLNAVNQRDGEVIINAFLIYTVDPSKPESVKEAMELGRKEIPLILEHFRKSLPGWQNAQLNGFPNYLYIREYNHYETDYVLKVSDLLGAKMYADNVSIGGYPLDLQGTSANKWGIEMGRPDKYGMPLRSFLLKNYENVIMAGKNVGSSALAYGSARIQPNTALAAESIGVILGQLQGKKKLRELTDADWPALHSYLDSKYQIKVTGVKGTNKIAGWTDEEIRKLDAGEIIYPSYVKTRK